MTFFSLYYLRVCVIYDVQNMDTSAFYVHDLIRFSFSAGKNLTFCLSLLNGTAKKK